MENFSAVSDISHKIMKNLLLFPISVISHESSEPDSLFYPLQKRKLSCI
jgi:hypothetical protein